MSNLGFMQLVGGIGPDGKPRAIAVNPDGSMKTTGGGGTGGGSGGAIASTIWTDNSGAYYVRRDIVDSETGTITVTFVTPTGTSATPGAGLRPLASTDRDVQTAYYEAITSGTGYTTGDLLARTLIIDANPSTPTLTAIWLNFNTGAVITAPSTANIERADENITIRGDVAAGATDSGNPVKVGGVYNATTPTLANGQRGNAQLSQRSNLLVDTIDYVSSATNIQVVDSNSTTSVGQDNQNIIRGNPTNNSFASYMSSGNSSFAILIENQPTGTPFVGTLQIERSLDGAIWTAIGAFVAGSAYTRSQITAEAVLHGNCSSSQFLRVRAIAWTSGIARVTFLAGQGTGTITIGNPIRLYDQLSNAQASIKAAGIQQLLADTALVTVSRDTLNTEITGSASASNTDIINTSVDGYAHFSVQITGTFNASIAIQGSNTGNANDFVNVIFQSVGSNSINVGGNIGSPGILEGRITFKFIRIRIFTYTSGTVSANLQLHKIPRSPVGLSAINSIINTVTASIASIVLPPARIQNYLQGTINASGDSTIIAAQGGTNRIHITSVTIQLETATTTTVLFKSGTTTFRRLRCVADGDGLDKTYSPGSELRLGANEAFILNLSGANTVGYSIEYYVS